MGKDLGKNVNKDIKKKIRSAGYPALDLGSAILAARKVFGDLGQGPHSRPSLARGLGYKNFCGPASAKIGALVHFGLLEKFGGNYSITGLAKTLFGYPKNDCQKEMFAAAVKPALFGALAARFAGEILPNNLAAILAGDYKISVNAAPRAAQNFVKTVKIAEMLKDGVLILPDDQKNDEGASNFDMSVENADDPENKDIPAKKNSIGAQNCNGIKIKLSSGIEIVFPPEFALRLSMGEFAADLKTLDEKSKFALPDG